MVVPVAATVRVPFGVAEVEEAEVGFLFAEHAGVDAKGRSKRIPTLARRFGGGNPNLPNRQER